MKTNKKSNNSSANPVSNVYLANNGLRSISYNLLQWSDVEHIRLEGNPLRCDIVMFFFLNFVFIISLSLKAAIAIWRGCPRCRKKTQV